MKGLFEEYERKKKREKTDKIFNAGASMSLTVMECINRSDTGMEF